MECNKERRQSSGTARDRPERLGSNNHNTLYSYYYCTPSVNKLPSILTYLIDIYNINMFN